MIGILQEPTVCHGGDLVWERIMSHALCRPNPPPQHVTCSWWYLTRRWRCTSCSGRCASPPHLCRTVALAPGGCRTAAAWDLCPPSAKSPSRPRKRRTWTSPGSGTGSAGVQQAELRGRNPGTAAGQTFQTETQNFCIQRGVGCGGVTVVLIVTQYQHKFP